MPRGAFLNEIEKGKIIAFKEEGLKIQDIAKKLNRSFAVVRNFLSNPEVYGKNKTGGPKKNFLSGNSVKLLKKLATYH